MGMTLDHPGIRLGHFGIFSNCFVLPATFFSAGQSFYAFTGDAP